MVGRADKKLRVRNVCFFKHVRARTVAYDAFYVELVDGFFDFVAVDVHHDDVVSLVRKFLHKGCADCAQTADNNVHCVPLCLRIILIITLIINNNNYKIARAREYTFRVAT